MCAGVIVRGPGAWGGADVMVRGPGARGAGGWERGVCWCHSARPRCWGGGWCHGKRPRGQRGGAGAGGGGSMLLFFGCSLRLQWFKRHCVKELCFLAPMSICMQR